MKNKPQQIKVKKICDIASQISKAYGAVQYKFKKCTYDMHN